MYTTSVYTISVYTISMYTISVYTISVYTLSMYTMYVQGCSEWRKGEGQGGINILERSYSCPTCT